MIIAKSLFDLALPKQADRGFRAEGAKDFIMKSCPIPALPGFTGFI